MASSRTLNPLHFEDLEPHRFEDLIRQLAYGYRPWRYLDATGRLGRDGGTDIRGIEPVGGKRQPVTVIEDDETDEELEPAIIDDEREWLISCKRYKEIGPKEVRQIVAETLKDQNNPPYGYVLAAACDVSNDTMAAFRDEAFNRGATEAHLWTKAHLEDMLFLPENDGLLFAYFGISLTTRRRTRVTAVRNQLTMKRQLLRALKIEEISDYTNVLVMIRDIEDTAYPYMSEVPNFFDDPCPPWHLAEVTLLKTAGLLVSRQHYIGWVKQDGTWDMFEGSASLPYAEIGWDYWQEYQSHQREKAVGEYDSNLLFKVPDFEQRTIDEVAYIPFEFVLEVDSVGDYLNNGTQLYCRFDGTLGPYVAHNGPDDLTQLIARPGNYQGALLLDSDKRRPLIEELADSLAEQSADADATGPRNSSISEGEAIQDE